jgi:polysaccharide biosynthesis protein PslH
VNSLENKRKKLVIITSRFPYPLEKGDKLRAYHQLKELSLHFDIVLISTSDTKVHQKDIDEIRKYCKTIYILYLNKLSILFNLTFQLFTQKPFQIGYFYSSRNNARIKNILKEEKPDHIYCQLIRVAEYVKDYHECSKTIDYMDALSKGMERRSVNASIYSKWLFNIEAKRLSNYERKIFDYFENQIMISEQDKDFILHPDRNKIICTPNGVDDSFFESIKMEKNAEIVFIGNLSYAPNIEAIHYLVDHINPYFLTQNEKFKILISGTTPSNTIKKLVKENPNIELTGWVEDIRNSYSRGKIFVAPMMIGTGMQNKLIEAMAMGIPCVTTSLANNAIKGKHKESIMVANTKEEFIMAIEELLNNKELYNKIVSKAKELIHHKYRWKGTTTKLIQVVKQS